MNEEYYVYVYNKAIEVSNNVLKTLLHTQYFCSFYEIDSIPVSVAEDLFFKVLEKIKKSQEKNHEKQKGAYWKDKKLQIIENYDFSKFKILIEQDLTIPEIHSIMKEYTYDQVYDTIYSDKELNILYRKHGQTKIKGVK